MNEGELLPACCVVITGPSVSRLLKQQEQESHTDDHQKEQQLNPLLLGFLQNQMPEAKQCLQIPKAFRNGLITNDKFCLTRYGELQLSWWRRSLRLRG